MKHTKWIVCAFLSFILITPSILHAAQENGVAHRVAALEAAVESLTTALDAANTEIANLQSELSIANTAISNLQTELAEVQSNTVLNLDRILTYDTDTSGYPRALFTGVNVQIVNGLGATNGYPDDPISDNSALTQVNGIGNLIIGYNEGPPAGQPPQSREGSHNIVMGRKNSYSSYDGLISGRSNNIADHDSYILGGKINIASGGVIVDSFYSQTTGPMSVVVAGDESTASGGVLIHGRESGTTSGVVIEGYRNGSTNHGVVLGGEHNAATGIYSVITGGIRNRTNDTASYSSISGGMENVTEAHASSIVGGSENITEGNFSSILGGLLQNTTSSYETIPALP